tara:strand:- start:1524 stop:1724 length:201 start_codon:yes stop_codon:yes gene_type:complete
MIYVLLGVGSMQLERLAKQRSLDLRSPWEDPLEPGDTRANPFVFRGIRGANLEERTYPCQIKIGRV